MMIAVNIVLLYNNNIITIVFINSTKSRTCTKVCLCCIQYQEDHYFNSLWLWFVEQKTTRNVRLHCV